MVKNEYKEKKYKKTSKKSRPFWKSEYWKFWKTDCSFLRSDEMILCEIYIQPEICYTFISTMGELELLEFLDANLGVIASKREYVNQLRLCDELELKVLYLIKVMKEHKIQIPPYYDNPPVPPEKELVEEMNPQRSEFSLLRKLTDEVEEVTANTDQLNANLASNKEFAQILIRLLKLYYMATGKRHPLFDRAYDEEQEIGSDVGMRVFGGIIQRDKMMGMEILLMRLCRGNYILSVDELTEPIYSKEDLTRKCVFLIFFQGAKTEQRIIAIAKAARAQIYQAEDNKLKCEALLANCKEYISQTEKILATSLVHLKKVLNTAAPRISKWHMQVLKMKAIYHTLNLIDTSEKMMIARCWVPKKNLPHIYGILKYAMEENQCVGSPIIHKIHTDAEPPTCIKLNKFTVAFQNIIHAYGIASYQELNPMPYTVITFPFLFAIMFGDSGHGLIMTLFALFMVTFEKSLDRKNIPNEIWQILFNGRYVILLMGIASLYTGSVYNDVFSLGYALFPSSWKINYNKSTLEENPMLQLNPSTDYKGTPYPFGIDPVWKLAENQIDFLNSFKMKLSIILGVIQMYFGIMLSLLNHLYFKNYSSIYGEFVPQILFFTCLFGYLIFLAFYKWYVYGPNREMIWEPGCAPAILITFINMILLKESDIPEGCKTEMYSHQKIIQKVFLAIALICVPWMLLVKPLSAIQKQKKLAAANEVETDNAYSAEMEIKHVKKFQKFLHKHLNIPEPVSKEQHQDEGFFSDFIHQCIHTIEFVLGSVSYTASYLRLWALSLAHSQLSEVLWERVFLSGMQPGLGDYAFPFCYAVFLAWASLSVAILVIMEGLSAFLHALRLHWMEFQSKFYTGSGYIYSAFSFKNIRRVVNK